MKFEDRIHQKLKELNISAADVTRKTHNVVTKANMSQWLSGSGSPNIFKCYALAKALDTTVDWLVSGKLPPPIKPVDFPPEYEVYKKYPILGWIQAGGWSSELDLTNSDTEYGISPYVGSDNAFILRVVGESMSPEFMPGDMILVEPDSQPGNGDFVIARLSNTNEATFKQLIIESDGKMLKALNPDWPERFIPINGECLIIGVVKGKWKSYS